jgi:hypothetical protein
LVVERVITTAMLAVIGVGAVPAAAVAMSGGISVTTFVSLANWGYTLTVVVETFLGIPTGVDLDVSGCEGD